jgi:hypothetical protein
MVITRADFDLDERKALKDHEDNMRGLEETPTNDKDTEQKWREEFDEWRKGCSYSPMVRVAYLAARKKSQKEIDKLCLKFPQRALRFEQLENEIEKRDKLLEQAIFLLNDSLARKGWHEERDRITKDFKELKK